MAALNDLSTFFVSSILASLFNFQKNGAQEIFLRLLELNEL